VSDMDLILGAGLALGLLGYLFFALLWPEKLQ
jgi:K+-transporting ATPase KdpF subunit